MTALPSRPDGIGPGCPSTLLTQYLLRLLGGDFLWPHLISPGGVRNDHVPAPDRGLLLIGPPRGLDRRPPIDDDPPVLDGVNQMLAAAHLRLDVGDHPGRLAGVVV